jgi:hypothetical protein
VLQFLKHKRDEAGLLGSSPMQSHERPANNDKQQNTRETRTLLKAESDANESRSHRFFFWQRGTHKSKQIIQGISLLDKNKIPNHYKKLRRPVSSPNKKSKNHQRQLEKEKTVFQTMRRKAIQRPISQSNHKEPIHVVTWKPSRRKIAKDEQNNGRLLTPRRTKIIRRVATDVKGHK